MGTLSVDAIDGQSGSTVTLADNVIIAADKGISWGSGTSSTLHLTNVDTLTIPNDAISGDKISGGTIDTFKSTGIDDNATETAITIGSDENITLKSTTSISSTTKFRAIVGTGQADVSIAVSSGDVDGATANVQVAGEIASILRGTSGDANKIKVTFNTAMADTNYFVLVSIHDADVAFAGAETMNVAKSTGYFFLDWTGSSVAVNFTISIMVGAT